MGAGSVESFQLKSRRIFLDIAWQKQRLQDLGGVILTWTRAL